MSENGSTLYPRKMTHDLFYGIVVCHFSIWAILKNRNTYGSIKIDKGVSERRDSNGQESESHL